MAKKKNVKNTNLLVGVVVDESGSMSSVFQQTIDGYKEMIQQLRADKEGITKIIPYTFNGIKGAQKLHNMTTVDKAKVMGEDVKFEPNGNTPLYDAIVTCIKDMEKKVSGHKDYAFMVNIITDGYENASETTSDAVKDLIAKKEKDGWTFTYLGANQDAVLAAGAMGINITNTANYMAHQTRDAFKSMASSSNLRKSMGAEHGTLLGIYSNNEIPVEEEKESK